MRMNTLKAALALFTVSASIVACNPSTNNTATTAQDSTAMQDTSASIMIHSLGHSKDFPGATLKIADISAVKVGTDSAKITVNYAVENFKLTEQTEHDNHLANSHDGQHIHFILDNTPYAALYKPTHSVTVPVNSEHTLMSFLSRSYHESIKTAEASKLIKFKVDADGKIVELPAPTDPSLFYSRPKGDYKGADTKQLLLDFFVSNTTLAADGHKVLVNVNGKDFTFDKWVPYEILNLPLGENVIKITLIDKDGKALTGENVSVERKINLTAE